jgi:hypothetical protein
MNHFIAALAPMRLITTCGSAGVIAVPDRPAVHPNPGLRAGQIIKELRSGTISALGYIRPV